MAKYFLAVDGGGTKTDVVCANENGDVIGRGVSGPTNITTTSVGAASFNLIEAIRQSIESLPIEEAELGEKEFPILVMGLAGLDSSKEYEEAYKVFSQAIAHYNIKKLILVNDSLIALENGSNKPNAVILISGTGSNCFGRNEAGQTAKTSGVGFLLADQGSGYAVGRRVLREAVKSYDGRTEKSLLEGLVCEYFKISSIGELKNEVYNPLLTKVEVANLSYLCSKAYEQGDNIARDIFEKTVNEIITMVSTVVDKLELADKDFDCVFSGAVTQIPFIKESVSAILQEKYTHVAPVFPGGDPVFGALKIAMRE
jgi:N-acetylglucosamine kinase-like BadF-type ATPase